MKKQSDEETFVSHMKAAMDSSADDLSDEICSRLERSRRNALAHLKSGNSRSLKWIRLSFAGLAAAGLVWTASVFFHQDRDGLVPGITPQDMAIVTSGEHVDLYANLDFYSWLVEKREKGAIPE